MTKTEERKNIVKEVEGGVINFTEEAKRTIARFKEFERKMSEVEAEMKKKKEQNKKAILEINRTISEIDEMREEMREKLNVTSIELIVYKDGVIKNKKNSTEVIPPSTWQEDLNKIMERNDMKHLNIIQGVSIAKVISIWNSSEQITFSVEFEDPRLYESFEKIILDTEFEMFDV